MFSEGEAESLVAGRYGSGAVAEHLHMIVIRVKKKGQERGGH